MAERVYKIIVIEEEYKAMTQPNKSTVLLLVALLLLLLLPACTSGSSAADEPTAGAPAGDVEELAEEEEAAAPADEEQACAGTITLGAAVSETGKYAREGKDTRQGYDTWLEWVNNEYGGIQVGDDCYQVEIIYYDDESNPDTAANLVERLITEHCLPAPSLKNTM
jgi:branched-chain amino acid transport system substrate-binding protein